MELAINIESPIFDAMLKDVDKEIKRCMKQVMRNYFEGAELNIKITIDIPEAEKEIPLLADDGELINKNFKYRKPNIKHKVTSTLKKQYKREGCYCECKQVVEKDGEFLVVPIVEDEPPLLRGYLK